MKRSRTSNPSTAPAARELTELRIVGGTLRGRSLAYSGEERTRPMKDRVREAVFNLLGPAVVGTHAIDLFAGTGALGLEAISRGAVRATLIERHLPTCRLIEANAAQLGVADQVHVQFADAFKWGRRDPPSQALRWLVFFSPPYDFYVTLRDDTLRLIERYVREAPAGSLIVVEANEEFDLSRLPAADKWDVRSYPPATVAILATSGPGTMLTT